MNRRGYVSDVEDANISLRRIEQDGSVKLMDKEPFFFVLLVTHFNGLFV